jgi:integrase
VRVRSSSVTRCGCRPSRLPSRFARLGEMLGLRWAHIDLDGGTLRAHQALQRVGNKLRFVEPKSERSRRVVALPSFAIDALKRQQERPRGERLLAGSKWVNGGLVFTTTIGTPLDERNVRRAFKAVLKETGLPSIRIHDLRHTTATLLLTQGVHPRVVMETLGHSQISLTLDTYSHVLPSSSSRGREANGGGSWREWLSNRAERRDRPARIAKFLRKSGEPHFRELEPDRGLAPPHRRASCRSVKPRDD